MKEKIHIYQLDESESGIEVFRISDIMEVQDISEEIYAPHRHDHYCCFFIESGRMNFNVDFQNVDIQASSLLVSCPGQVHAFGTVSDIAGWMIAFDPKFADRNARMVFEQSFSRVALLHLNDSDKNWFNGLFEVISASKEEHSSHFQQQLLQTLINAFFLKAAAVFELQERQRIQAFTVRGTEIAKNFQSLIKQHFIVSKKPSDYASEMNISVSYLNDTVKSVTGFSSTYLIHQEIFTEAQRLLFYTHKSVKEIAYELGYEDYKYFIRLFSKTVGVSPTGFRKKNGV